MKTLFISFKFSIKTNNPDKKRYGILAALILLVIPSVSFSDSSTPPPSTIQLKQLLDSAKTKMDAGQVEEAYQILLPFEFEMAGTKGYDYLLGTAALDSNRASEAIFILQRAVDVDESHHGARLELARAYFNNGNYEQAKYHFNLLTKAAPPPNVTKAIGQYLLSIDQKMNQYQPRFIPFVDFSIGYDSNANSATTDSEATYLFNGIEQNPTPLGKESIQNDSVFINTGVGGYLTYPKDDNERFIISTALYSRENENFSYLDNSNISLSAQYQWSSEKTTISPSVGGFRYWLDDKTNFYSNFFDMSVFHQATTNTQLNATLRTQSTRYKAEEDQIRDSNQHLTIIGATYAYDDNPANNVGINCIFGKDNAINTGTYYDSQQQQVQLSLNWAFSNRLLINANTRFGFTDYPDFKDVEIYNQERNDKTVNHSVSVKWLDVLDNGWQLSGTIHQSETRSSIKLYEYNKSGITFSLYKAFE